MARVFTENGARHSIQDGSQNNGFIQGASPGSLGTRVRGIFSLGGMSTIIVEPNIHYEPSRRHHDAGSDAGRHQKHRRHGYGGDVAVECNRCAILHGFRRVGRHTANQRYRDH
jgi:hypothetical protein